MTEPQNSTTEVIAHAMFLDIATWHESELESGNCVPDFWDDCATSERLANYLIEHGWTKP